MTSNSHYDLIKIYARYKALQFQMKASIYILLISCCGRQKLFCSLVKLIFFLEAVFLISLRQVPSRICKHSFILGAWSNVSLHVSIVIDKTFPVSCGSVVVFKKIFSSADLAPLLPLSIKIRKITACHIGAQ